MSFLYHVFLWTDLTTLEINILNYVVHPIPVGGKVGGGWGVGRNTFGYLICLSAHKATQWQTCKWIENSSLSFTVIKNMHNWGCVSLGRAQSLKLSFLHFHDVIFHYFIFHTSYFMTSYIMTSYMTSYFMTPYFMASYLMTHISWYMMQAVWCMMHETHRGMHPQWISMKGHTQA